jgi:hypothetical protein
LEALKLKVGAWISFVGANTETLIQNFSTANIKVKGKAVPVL